MCCYEKKALHRPSKKVSAFFRLFNHAFNKRNDFQASCVRMHHKSRLCSIAFLLLLSGSFIIIYLIATNWKPKNFISLKKHSRSQYFLDFLIASLLKCFFKLGEVSDARHLIILPPQMDCHKNRLTRRQLQFA